MNGEDANRIWDAINAQGKDLAGMNTGMAVLGVEMRAMREELAKHKIPCEPLSKHLDRHDREDEEKHKAAQEETKTWRDFAVGLVVKSMPGLVGGAGAGGIIWAILNGTPK